jgi:hypothetical protein
MILLATPELLLMSAGVLLFIVIIAIPHLRIASQSVLLLLCLA